MKIWFESQHVATLDPGVAGPSLVYEDSWRDLRGAFPISSRMSLKERRHSPDIVLPWLMNLLPEGETLRAMGKINGVSPEDPIGMLAKHGRDAAGAFSFGKQRIATNPRYRELDPKELERILNELPARPFLAGDDDISLSLAGQQDKLPVRVEDSKVYLPLGGAASTHILKPANRRLHGSVQNEAMALRLARRLGMDAVEVTTGKAGDLDYLVVARYDRRVENDRILRIHQEDFCQALGKPPSAKYERNQSGVRGPAVTDLIRVMRQLGNANDVLRIVDAIVFNVAITNVDSHAKNYSILIDSAGFRLAPFYDMMIGHAWDKVTKNMAQTIGTKRDGRHIQTRHWQIFADDCGLSPRLLLKNVEKITRAAGVLAKEAAADVAAMPAGTSSNLGDFQATIETRCRTMRINIGTIPADPSLKMDVEEAEEREDDIENQTPAMPSPKF